LRCLYCREFTDGIAGRILLVDAEQDRPNILVFDREASQKVYSHLGNEFVFNRVRNASQLELPMHRRYKERTRQSARSKDLARAVQRGQPLPRFPPAGGRYLAEFAGRIAAMLYVGIVQLLNETRDAISSVRSPQVSYSADKRGRAKQGR
jgi:hypothetical protein